MTTGVCVCIACMFVSTIYILLQFYYVQFMGMSILVMQGYTKWHSVRIDDHGGLLLEMIMAFIS